jgi:hypothetical protein
LNWQFVDELKRRHGRGSTRDLLNVPPSPKKAGFKILNDRWTDTTAPHGHLMLTVGPRRCSSPMALSNSGTTKVRRADERGLRYKADVTATHAGLFALSHSTLRRAGRAMCLRT